MPAAAARAAISSARNAGVTLRVLRGKRQLEVGGTSFRGVRLQRTQQTRTIDSAIAQVEDNFVEVVGKKHGCTRQVAAGVSGARIQLFQGALGDPSKDALRFSTLPAMSRRCASRELPASRTITFEASARP